MESAHRSARGQGGKNKEAPSQRAGCSEKGDEKGKPAKKSRRGTTRQREEGKKILAVIDGTCVVFRSHFGMPEVLDGGGVPVQAIIGFFRSLAAIRRALLQPSHLVVVFDGPESRESRKAIFDGYKGHRSETPASLVNQFAIILRLCERMQITTLSEPGVEADDVIATLVNRACRLSRLAAEKRALAAEEERQNRDGEAEDEQKEEGSGIDGVCIESQLQGRCSGRTSESRAARQREDRRLSGDSNDTDVVFDEIVVATADKDLLQVLQHNYMEPTAVTSSPSAGPSALAPSLTTEASNCMREGTAAAGEKTPSTRGKETVARLLAASGEAATPGGEAPETRSTKQPKIRIMQLHKKMQIIDDTWVKMEYGVAAHQIRDYLALTGDSVDGITGCPSIGPITAQKIVSAASGNVNALLQNGAALRRLLKPSQVKHLSTFLPLFERNQHLVSLNYEVESLSNICLSRFEVKKKASSFAPLCSRLATPSSHAAKPPYTHALRQHVKAAKDLAEGGKFKRHSGCSFSSIGLPFFRSKARKPAQSRQT
ncbi:putative DNA polymerase I [Neospora caninum Liverpool]|uniref:DNA polymerase I, putative n=1 Tax=Neospora caninum (strain Liverpool) TaxID=572307 RepID=F0VHB0_NEOCL|nr:putative DNA polymerase I [Neospora caninum Liverpool]CBZ53104.1 putative DNA polymerase I [Neospora caninum Liverpool]CEL67089.1 TPA: DNA polymerase I, putative [Neospora caninum Liverpool]|eukprot:XP_003883136.1 putative DNA polymerase I [Neospora caninum Liverpool]